MPGEVCVGVERTVSSHISSLNSIITEGVHLKKLNSWSSCCSLVPAHATNVLNIKEKKKYQGKLVILSGCIFFLPKETYGVVWCMSHQEGF